MVWDVYAGGAIDWGTTRGKRRVSFEDRGREGFSVWTAEGPLGGKVKEKWIVVVEFVE